MLGYITEEYKARCGKLKLCKGNDVWDINSTVYVDGEIETLGSSFYWDVKKGNSPMMKDFLSIYDEDGLKTFVDKYGLPYISVPGMSNIWGGIGLYRDIIKEDITYRYDKMEMTHFFALQKMMRHLEKLINATRPDKEGITIENKIQNILGLMFGRGAHRYAMLSQYTYAENTMMLSSEFWFTLDSQKSNNFAVFEIYFTNVIAKVKEELRSIRDELGQVRRNQLYEVSSINDRNRPKGEDKVFSDVNYVGWSEQEQRIVVLEKFLQIIITNKDYVHFCFDRNEDIEFAIEKIPEAHLNATLRHIVDDMVKCCVKDSYDCLLNDLRLRFDISQTLDAKTNVYIDLDTWGGIVCGMVNYYMAGKSTKRCNNPECTKYFYYYRKDHKYCSSICRSRHKRIRDKDKSALQKKIQKENKKSTS